jgi:CBS-domain-containing membrane protein
MKARDVMVYPVITVRPYSTVGEVARTLLERRISAVPVVDDRETLVGIVSEGDLLHRTEAGTERQRPWWLLALTADETLAAEYARAHAVKVVDIMTRRVITAAPDTPLSSIADLLERNSIKRLPIVRDGRLVGIVSRANLIQAVASRRKELEVPLSDTAIRDKVLARLQAQPWARTWHLNITVTGGVVDLWGVTRSDVERKAIRIAAEGTPGVQAVNDRLMLLPIDTSS